MLSHAYLIADTQGCREWDCNWPHLTTHQVQTFQQSSSTVSFFPCVSHELPTYSSADTATLSAQLLLIYVYLISWHTWAQSECKSHDVAFTAGGSKFWRSHVAYCIHIELLCTRKLQELIWHFSAALPPASSCTSWPMTNHLLTLVALSFLWHFVTVSAPQSGRCFWCPLSPAIAGMKTEGCKHAAHVVR